jgi:hypothetical protein
MRGTLMGVLIAASAGSFVITNVSAAPVTNGDAIGEAISTSLPIELVGWREHRREESRERRHRREESRERRHPRREPRAAALA